MAIRVGGSFRDPSGHVYDHAGRIFRTVREPGRSDYEFVKAAGFLEEQARRGRVIDGPEVPPSDLGVEAADACYVLEHPRLAFISHPYEWSTGGLRAAALLTLELHLEGLEHDVSMSDASAYNVQFDGARPIHIDYLSFRRYRVGELWDGHRQFCEQFLNPLLLVARTGVPFNAMYRGRLSGIPAGELAPLLPWKSRLMPNVFLHVGFPARMARRANSKRTAPKRLAAAKLPKASLKQLLRGMHRWVERLQPPAHRRTPWQVYADANSYGATARGHKAAFVETFVRASRPSTVWDLGCNTGEFARVALDAGAELVIGFESDPGALEAAFRRAEQEQLLIHA